MTMEVVDRLPDPDPEPVIKETFYKPESCGGARMHRELLEKKEAVMNACCELCRWPAGFGEDEDVQYEEHCNHCPAALAVDALCEALRAEGMIDGSQLTKDGKLLVEYIPEAVNSLAYRLTENMDSLVMWGRVKKTNAFRLVHLTKEQLADEIFDNLAQFPTREALLAYLRQEATDADSDA